MTACIDVASINLAREESFWENHTRLALLKELDTYTRWLYERVRPFVAGDVCEVGCGTGNIIEFLLNQPRVVGLEPFPPSFEEARQRFFQHRNVQFLGYSLADCPNEAVPAASFDTVLCMNVLEHIEDDVDSLRRMGTMCRAGGRVVILVPAHQALYGGLDRTAGHFRRYNRKSLSQAFIGAGLRVTDSYYMNVVGFFGWFWFSRVLGRTELPAKSARFFNRLVPFLDAFERVIKLPFGQSLVMVGEQA